MIETLGLALIPAYGLLLTGGAIAVCGAGIAMIGDTRWSEPDRSLSIASQLKELMWSLNRGRHPADPSNGGSR